MMITYEYQVSYLLRHIRDDTILYFSESVLLKRFEKYSICFLTPTTVQVFYFRTARSKTF